MEKIASRKNSLKILSLVILLTPFVFILLIYAMRYNFIPREIPGALNRGMNVNVIPAREGAPGFGPRGAPLKQPVAKLELDIGKRALLLFAATGLLIIAKTIKEAIWRTAKAAIVSEEGFYSILFVTTIITMSLVELIATLGLILFFLSTDLTFSVLLIILSIIGMSFYYPRNAEIARRKLGFNFHID